MKFTSNQPVIVSDEALERHGQAGAVVGAVKDFDGKETGEVEVKFDVDNEVEHVPEASLKAL